MFEAFVKDLPNDALIRNTKDEDDKPPKKQLSKATVDTEDENDDEPLANRTRSSQAGTSTDPWSGNFYELKIPNSVDAWEAAYEDLDPLPGLMNILKEFFGALNPDMRNALHGPRDDNVLLGDIMVFAVAKIMKDFCGDCPRRDTATCLADVLAMHEADEAYGRELRAKEARGDQKMGLEEQEDEVEEENEKDEEEKEGDSGEELEV